MRCFVKDKQILKKRIEQAELQLKKLSIHQTNSEVCEDLYNSLILEKAVLKKQLEELNKNPVIEKVKKMIPRRKKLICDYFS